MRVGAASSGRRSSSCPTRHLGEVGRGQVRRARRRDLPVAGRRRGRGTCRSRRSRRPSASASTRRMVLLWGSFCGVHTVFKPRAGRRTGADAGYRVLVHPECPKDVVDAADGAGSTNYLWKAMTDAKPGDKLAIAHRGPLRPQRARASGADAASRSSTWPTCRAHAGSAALGCGCATMSRNDPAAPGGDPRPACGRGGRRT